MNKIKYVSLFFRLLFQIIFICLVFIQVTGWIYAPMQGDFFNVIPSSYHAYILSSFTKNTKIAGFCVTMIPTVIKLFVFYFLIKLFRLYEQLEYFSVRNIHYIRNAGYALLLEQIVNPFCEFLLGFILTSDNPPGFRLATITITDTNFGLILTALVIILVSWITTEGYKLQNEQQLTI